MSGNHWNDLLHAFSAQPTLWTDGLSGRAAHILLRRFNSRDQVKSFIKQHGATWHDHVPGLGHKSRFEVENWLNLW